MLSRVSFLPCLWDLASWLHHSKVSCARYFTARQWRHINHKSCPRCEYSNHQFNIDNVRPLHSVYCPLEYGHTLYNLPKCGWTPLLYNSREERLSRLLIHLVNFVANHLDSRLQLHSIYQINLHKYRSLHIHCRIRRVSHSSKGSLWIACLCNRRTSV